MSAKSKIFLWGIILALAAAILFFGIPSTPSTYAGNATYSVEMYLFYGQGCPHCAALEEFLDGIKGKYPIILRPYEIYYNQENREFFEKMTKAYGKEIEGVPTLFIGNKVIVGYSNSMADLVEAEIAKCSVEGCISPAKKIEGNVTEISTESSPAEHPEVTEMKKKLTIPAVIGAAIVDSINPCEFAILIILLSTILVSNSRKKALFAGLAFSLAIFISYFLMGLGIYSAVRAASFTRIFYVIVSILAIVIGLFNLKDYFWYGKWFRMEVPMRWRPRMKMIIKSVTSVPGAFLVGFVISLFLLPCTSGPYIVILGLLAETATKSYAISLLLLYNLIFIIPMLAITFMISAGVATTAQAEEWRQRKIKVLHLIAAIILLALGVFMLLSRVLGVI